MRALHLLLASSVLVGCQTKHTGTYEVAQASAGGGDAVKVEADQLWEQRADKAKLQAALVKYEAAYQTAPTDREIGLRLVRGYYFLGDAYEDDKEAKLAAWDQSISWGKRCLAINHEFTALLEKGDEDEASAARALTVEDVPCLYWSSSALGKWGKLSGLGKTLKNLPTVKAWMTRVGELDPDYNFSGPDRYWGAYYCAIPSFAGQDLDKCRELLEKASAANPEYLGTKVLLADYWARKTQDKEVFNKAIAEVLAADPNAVAEIAPENMAEQEKARKLQENVSEYFAD